MTENTIPNTPKMLDIVICGPDYSGTTTQIGDAIQFFKQQGLHVKDLRGNEVDAFFHTEKFQKQFGKYISLKDAQNNLPVANLRDYFRSELKKSKVPAAIQSENFSFINPDSADVFVMEEPTYRGSGADIRNTFLYASNLGESVSQTTKAQSYAADRLKEFIRFRKHFREAGKIILRSRSEESACYQINDPNYLLEGISKKEYFALEGNKIAFANPPTDIITVSGKPDWTVEEMIALRQERGGNRITDDHEKDTQYQLLVNKRYANHWLDNLYTNGCPKGVITPDIHRLYINEPKEVIRSQIEGILESALQQYDWK